MTHKTKRGAATEFFNTMMASAPYPSECITWPFARSALGYGVFGKRRGEVRSAIVSRVACSIAHGQPPSPDHEAAHLCGRGAHGCVNPGHLAWKTSAENKADQIKHGTRNRGERNGGAKITAAVAAQIRAMAQDTKQVSIAKEFGLSQSAVSLIVSGRNWGHL